MPNWKKVIVSGSDAILNTVTTTGNIIAGGDVIANNYIVNSTVTNVTMSFSSGSTIFGDSLDDTHLLTGSTDITGSLTVDGMTYPTTDGTDGQVLTTDGLGNLSFQTIEDVYVTVKNVSGGTLAKGTPVHATSSVSSGNATPVIAASASNASTMPATFVLNETLADEAEGQALLSGFIQGVNTSLFEVGEIAYVGENGGFTNVKPTGSSNLIQNLGIVTKVHATNGSGWVYGSGRSNDIPNLPTGKIWVGSDSYTVTSSVLSLNESQNKVDVTGDISASNNIYAKGYYVDGFIGLVSPGGNTIALGYENSTPIQIGKGGNPTLIVGPVTASIISSSNIVYAKTGSFSHLEGNSPITVKDTITFQSVITASSDISASGNISSRQNIIGSAYTFIDRKFANPSPLDSSGIDLGDLGDGNLLLTHLTASGNISASGTITANGATLKGNLTVTGSQVITGDINSDGTIRARVKSFDIPHPTRVNKRLVYGALEGPEHGIYCRGESKELKVLLPPEWRVMVNKKGITVQITPIGEWQPLYFKKLHSNWLYFGCSDNRENVHFYWEIKGERTDVDKLKTVQ